LCGGNPPSLTAAHQAGKRYDDEPFVRFWFSVRLVLNLDLLTLSKTVKRPRVSNIGFPYPHTTHHGGAKKVIAAQQRPHSASISSTVVPQARQRGGSTPSTTARPKRRNRPGTLAASCIATHHRAAISRVNTQSAWTDPINPPRRFSIAAPGARIATAPGGREQ
jgi:hypothetical protein